MNTLYIYLMKLQKNISKLQSKCKQNFNTSNIQTSIINEYPERHFAETNSESHSSRTKCAISRVFSM